MAENGKAENGDANGAVPLVGSSVMDKELYGASDKYAGYARSIALDDDEEEEETLRGGPRCAASRLWQQSACCSLLAVQAVMSADVVYQACARAAC